jgi:hypothetical protein
MNGSMVRPACSIRSRSIDDHSLNPANRFNDNEQPMGCRAQSLNDRQSCARQCGADETLH